ncbi:MAG: type II secretion system protein GspE [Candidatus Makaraimicrobium thalassicum]|nr:MAG: type II secretion system protein GspE [Candidatus Omnitrophota bacterium]
MLKLGEILINNGIITPQQLKSALDEGKRTGEVLGSLLVRMKFISRDELLEALAEQFGLRFIPSLKDVPIQKAAIKAVSARLVWHYMIMPLQLKGKVLTVAVSDPLAVWAAEDLKLQLGLDVKRVLVPEKEVQNAVRQHYGLNTETVGKMLMGEKPPERAPETEALTVRAAPAEDLAKAAGAAPVVKLVDQILSDAVSSRATDIHIEPYSGKVRVRCRIDGVLSDTPAPREIRNLYQAMAARIKILADMDLSERNLPQDGSAKIKVRNRQIDLRISVVPSLYGENVAIKILPVHFPFKLAELGFLPQDLAKMEELINRPHGSIFFTGPDGSGRTTTLYACLAALNKESVKVITIEDHVEYGLENVTQTQAGSGMDLTFGKALRSILRHDPDVIMLSEVTDPETAELAVKTSLTGPLTLSTLHTNDAPGGIMRLLDMGIEPYLVASSVNAVVSQRLVRVICPDCKRESRDTRSLPRSLKGIKKTFYGKGCGECSFTGYKGRTAIYEILDVNDDIRGLILKKASVSQIRKWTEKPGFRTLLDAGMEKVKKGITTPSEITRVME